LKAKLSDLIQEQIKSPSPIRQIMKMAEKQNIINMGLDPDEFISFGGGWVNHPAPEAYREAYVEICKNKKAFHKSGGYSTTLGELECRRQISEFEKELFNVSVFEENIIIGLGGTQLMHDLFRTISDPQDSIMFLDPTYPNYMGQLRFVLKNPKIVYLKALDEKNWSYLPDLEERIEEFKDLYENNHPKVILIVSPDNPTSQIIPQEFIESIMDVIKGKNSFLVIDFAYKTQYFKEPPKYFSWSPKDNPQLIALHSNSKWGRGLGRRMGWIEADKYIIDGLERAQQCSILCPDTLHQMALSKYIETAVKDHSLKDYIEESRKKYEKAAEITIKAIENYMKMKYLEPQGGLYTAVDVEKDSDEFITEVLKNTGVLFIPGKGFGPSMKNGIRISYGPLVENTDKIIEAMERVGDFLEKQ
jgi:aspartate/methionine/tyrosine aminotransferase